MDEMSGVESLKHGFETNNHKWWTFDNFSQKLVVLKRTFDSWSIVGLLVPIRDVKLVHTVKECILRMHNFSMKIHKLMEGTKIFHGEVGFQL